MGQRIAVFGGTFDPPHIGHLVVASEVRHRCGFDAVLLMVANDPWQKRSTRLITPTADRLAMVEAAVDGHDGLVASAMEIGRGGPTYTIDTVEELLAADPSGSVSLVMGADAVAGLPTWHRSDELRDTVDVVAVSRPSHPPIAQLPRWRVTVVDVPAIDVSSTDLRNRCSAGIPIDFLVPDVVRSEILGRGLYGVRR